MRFNYFRGGCPRRILAFALGEEAAAKTLVSEALNDPAGSISAAVAHWRTRVRRLAESVPEFRCSDARYERLYNRSLLHLLLCQWNTDAFCLRPYFATGGMNGGCICCYLWNLGGPFQLLPIIDPKALKEHLAVLYRLNLDRCYAFSPSDGAPLGPYYMINQEKMIFLIDAYVRETGDIGYLNETVDKDVAAALLGHLMEPKEFLGEYGIHSLSKLDPAYDANDVDNGGPGACPSFPAAICPHPHPRRVTMRPV